MKKIKTLLIILLVCFTIFTGCDSTTKDVHSKIDDVTDTSTTGAEDNSQKQDTVSHDIPMPPALPEE